MGVLTLLDQARAAGLTVEARGNRLVIKGAPTAATLARAVGESKADILAILSDRRSDPERVDWESETDVCPPVDTIADSAQGDSADQTPHETIPWRIEMDAWTDARREGWEERAAIMEYDGKLPRIEAEHRAFMETLRDPK